MMETLVTILGTFVVGYVVDRWKYGRSVTNAAREIAAKAEALNLPYAKDARKIAEQAIIMANLAEADKAAKHITEIRSTAHAKWIKAVDKAEAEARMRREGK